jgi:hypothetical protein
LNDDPKLYGLVYFIGARTGGPVKIGFTADRNVAVRLTQLQTASPEELVVLGTVNGGPVVERAIHNFLGSHVVRGEWFERDAALALLDRLKDDSTLPAGAFARRLTLVTDRLLQDDEEEEPLEVQVARDLIWDVAHALRSRNTEKPLPFRAWLVSQRDRDDPVGDLAEDVSRDSSFPAVGNLADYLGYITDRGSRPEVTRTVLEAWIECDIAAHGLPYSE